MRKLIIALFIFVIGHSVYCQSFQDTIPFRNDLGLIIIPITFNGEVKEFAFDTGAEHSVAYGWAKETLKSTRKTLRISSSSGLKSRMRFYESGLIELGSRKIRNHRILGANRNEIFTCYNIDGVLGVDIIEALNWTIDYEKKILIMYPANHTPEKVKNMHALDFDYNGSRPYVYLNRKGSKFRFLLDTGAGGSSNISTRNYNLTNLNELPQIKVFTGSFDVNGILTSTNPTIFQFPISESEKVSLSPIMYYNTSKSSKIGNRLWKGRELFINLKSEKLYVDSAEINQKYSSYACSVMYIKGKMRIMSILEGSEIWNMGLRQGDEVKSYNGKVYTDFCSLDSYHRSIVSEGKSFEIELMNGKKVTISKTSPL